MIEYSAKTSIGRKEQITENKIGKEDFCETIEEFEGKKKNLFIKLIEDQIHAFRGYKDDCYMSESFEYMLLVTFAFVMPCNLIEKPIKRGETTKHLPTS